MITYDKVNELELNHKYTYEELCCLLDEERVHGTTLYNQRKRWSQYFEWRTEGKTTATRFIITKIYKEIKVETVYRVDDKVFTSIREAEQYAKSL